MRESEIEEGIMKGGVEECIEEKEPDICIRQEFETSILLNIMILLLDSILLNPNLRCELLAMARMMMPEMKKRMPAKASCFRSCLL